MAEENVEEGQEGAKEKPPKKSSKGLLIIIVVVVLALAGGVFAFFQFTGGKDKGKEGAKADDKKAVKTALIALDPFVVNLAEQGRFLKVTMQFELADSTNQDLVKEKMPQLRDAIITLISSKSAESVSSPEGKYQMKDELLLRANNALGKETFKNLYFTEFVMQ
jgi:flagellar FliL protein